jgi:hypothetical protein
MSVSLIGNSLVTKLVAASRNMLHIWPVSLLAPQELLFPLKER